MTRADRAAEAQRLSAQGLNGLEIAAQLGISKSYAYSLLNDPTGDGDRLRKQTYAGVCIDCGGATNGSDGRANAPKRCAKCAAAKQHQERRWTPETVVDAMRLYAERHGRPPTATEWLIGERASDYPPTSAVLNVCGSWNNAMRSAGFEPRENYGKGGPGTLTDEELDRTVALYQEHGSADAVAPLVGLTAGGVRWRLERAGIKPRPRGAAMPSYNAVTAIDRDIDRTEDRIKSLEAEIEERREYLAALKRAKETIGSVNGNGAN